VYAVVHNAAVHTNPFTFGALALDEAFTDRAEELAELARDLENGQDVLVYAPRRYGKSSLVLRAAQEGIAHGVLVAYLDLMRTPTKERFAAALAKTIHSDLDTRTGAAADRAADLFRGLRIRPTIEVGAEGSLSFGFQPGRRAADIDDTIEHLLELPGALAADRKRRVAVVFDEFQEIVALDPHFPNLMRSVFQAQPGVGHVYLGSKRHVLETIFSDRNQPFWRSAKRLELGPIPAAEFAAFIRERFDSTDRGLTDGALERLVASTHGHPYATQELAYFVWELVPTGHFAHEADVETALGKVLRSEYNHFEKLWDRATQNQRLALIALVEEPTAAPYSAAYHARHELPARPTLQRALGTLVRDDVVGRSASGEYLVIEPFLTEWISRGQREEALSERLST
jgi:AAA+ ATPase superfamily predicted ATPase